MTLVSAALATIPSRLAHLGPVLETLPDASSAAARPHRRLGWAPFTTAAAGRSRSTTSRPRGAACPASTYLRMSEAPGSPTKLLPALDLAGPYEVLVVADDDRLAPPDFVARLAGAAGAAPVVPYPPRAPAGSRQGSAC